MRVKKNNDHLSEDLKSSAHKVGKLYPVLEDFYGNIIDGQHRLRVDKDWPKIRLENVKTEKDNIIIRLIGNACRRSVPAKEKTEMLNKLGSILLKEGLKPGEIAEKIAETTGMSYRWVVKYLPEKYKDPTQSRKRSTGSSDAHHATGFLAEIMEPPKKKKGLKISKYGNTNFVLLMLDKSFYSEFENDCLKLEVPPEYCVMKSLEEHHKKVRRAITLKNAHIHTYKIEPDVNSSPLIVKPLSITSSR